jgi:hypothetical protein
MTYIHGTNELIIELWKKIGIPSGTYFGLLESKLGKKNIPKGVNPVVDATKRNTSLNRSDIFDTIYDLFIKTKTDFPKKAFEKYLTPVVIFLNLDGFIQDPREDYIFLSPIINDKVQLRILKLNRESSYKERAEYICRADNWHFTEEVLI